MAASAPCSNSRPERVSSGGIDCGWASQASQECLTRVALDQAQAQIAAALVEPDVLGDIGWAQLEGDAVGWMELEQVLALRTEISRRHRRDVVLIVHWRIVGAGQAACKG